MPDSNNMNVRYDEGRKLFIVTLGIKGLREFEGSGSALSEAFTELAEQLEVEGI